MAIVLSVGFTICVLTVIVLGIMATLQAEKEIQFFGPPFQICVFLKLPRLMIVLTGIWLGYDCFLICVALYNGFEWPHTTNIQAVNIVLRDGTMLLLAIFAVRFVPLILLIVGSPVQAFVSITISWTLDSIICSRIHLRVEGLRNLGVRNRTAVESFIAM